MLKVYAVRYLKFKYKELQEMEHIENKGWATSQHKSISCYQLVHSSLVAKIISPKSK